MDDFRIVLDKLNDFTKYLYFHIMGEPLLHPHINELIDIASSNFFVNITTNGYLIDKVKDNKNIRQINISLHSYDKKYNKSLDEYLDNVFTSVDNLVVNNTIIKYRLWVDSVYKYDIINRLEEKYNIKIDSNSIKLSDNVYYEVEQEFIWPSLDNDYYCEVGSCRALRDHIGILVDGTVVPCCLDSEGIIKLGNIYKNEINDIINNGLFKEMKKGFQDNKKIHELCKKCNFYELRR
jgi:radical SAM protein with 4Fe4S-binding SPASM domain